VFDNLLQLIQGDILFSLEEPGQLALVDMKFFPKPVRRHPFPIEDFS
jgi:hypothetical protein